MSALAGYLEWGSRLAVLNSQPGIPAPGPGPRPGPMPMPMPMPRWGWGWGEVKGHYVKETP